MPVMGNVIKIEPETFYCMRQCREMSKHLKTLKNSVYDLEIKAEEELYDHFMRETLQRAA